MCNLNYALALRTSAGFLLNRLSHTLVGTFKRNLGLSGEAFLERPHLSFNWCISLLGCLDVAVNVKAKESKKEEMDVQGKLETTTTTLHDNMTPSNPWYS
jgi:hypothetical protein